MSKPNKGVENTLGQVESVKLMKNPHIPIPTSIRRVFPLTGSSSKGSWSRCQNEDTKLSKAYINRKRPPLTKSNSRGSESVLKTEPVFPGASALRHISICGELPLIESLSEGSGSRRYSCHISIWIWSCAKISVIEVGQKLLFPKCFHYGCQIQNNHKSFWWCT